MLSPELHAYVVAHGGEPDEIARDLIEETRATYPQQAGMLIAPEQAAFFTQLAKILNARRAVEVGTFTGYSALAIARGLADGGRLICFDISEEFTKLARRYWARAGLDDRVELRLGPAEERLRELPETAELDLAFIDAEKSSYPVYWNELVPRMRPGGVLLVDNVLQAGRVRDPDGSAQTRAVVEFNDLVTNDNRVQAAMLPLGGAV